MRVLLTRPAAQSKAFAESLPARFEVLISPVIEPEFLDVEVDVSAYDALVFTSQIGVAAYARLQGPNGKPAFCVGPKTAADAADYGLKAVAAGGDINALNRLIEDQSHDARLLHLSGVHTAGQVSGNADRITVYDQVKVALSETAQLLLAQTVSIAVPLFSARSARAFETQLHSGHKAELTAICLSNAVAEALEGDRFARIEHCDHPSAQSMRDKMSAIFPA